MKIHKERIETFPIPDDPDGGTITIVYLNEGQQQNLLARCRKLSLVFIDNKQETRTMVDEIILRNEGANTRIKSWTKVFDKNGKDLKCDKAGKIEFISEDGSSQILKDMIDELDEIVKEERGIEEKNLQSSQGGSPVSTDNPASDVD